MENLSSYQISDSDDEACIHEELVEKEINKPNTSQISPTKEVVKGEDVDYFGLADSSSDSDSEQCNEVSIKLTSDSSNSFSIKANHQSEKSPLPNSDFWHGKVDHLVEKPVWQKNMMTEKSQKLGKTLIKYDGKRTHENVTYNDKNIIKSYVPKKQKLLKDEATPTSPATSKLEKSCFYIHHKVTPHLHQYKHENRTPKRRIYSVTGHNGAINRISWCKAEYSHLILSASMDRTVKVWNVFSDALNCVQSLNFHCKAVKDAKWTTSGKEILSCGYDKTARLLDVETGAEVRSFLHSSYVTCLALHPVNHNLFVTGSNNCLECWDLRTSEKPRHTYTYKDNFGQVQDVAFLSDGSQFFSCNDLVSRDSADRNIMAWDFNKGVVLSNQIYQERFTCTRLKINPVEKAFVAQTNGNYICQFSTIRPYKMNKCKRYDGHQVEGYKIGCDISPNGKIVASGSSDEKIYFYDFNLARQLRKLDIGDVAMDVEWHPLLDSSVAVATWSGGIQVWQ